MPAYFEKYFWTHGRVRYKGRNLNSKASGHKDKATMEKISTGEIIDELNDGVGYYQE